MQPAKCNVSSDLKFNDVHVHIHPPLYGNKYKMHIHIDISTKTMKNFTRTISVALVSYPSGDFHIHNTEMQDRFS